MLQPASTYDKLTRNFMWPQPAAFNMASVVSDQWAAATPDRLAIRRVFDDGRTEDWSHLELNRAANRFANALQALGVKPGDRVALLLPQIPQTAIAHLATYKIGAIAVPLAALFGLEALSYRLSDSGANALVTDTAGLAKLSEVRDQLPGLDLVISVDGPEQGVAAFSDLQELSSDTFQTVRTRPNDPALMIYTSGTTGQPKGVLHGHRVLMGHMPGIELSQNFLGQPDDLFWTPADWAWAGGLLNALFPALSLGVPVVCHASRKFDPEFAFRLLEQQKIRNAFIPPTALRMLRAVENPASRFALNWRSVGSAGESLGKETYDWFADEFGFKVNEFYGQTECNAVLGSSAALGVTRSGAIGRATPGHDVAIIDEAGNPVPSETLGQIAVKRPDPVMFLEYWNKPEATKEKFIGNWMITGDQGVMDEDGYVHFVGRDDDLITSASYRIGPGEIEDCLIKHPAVALAAAVGKPDPLRTEIVKAYVVLKTGEQPTPALEDSIRSFVRDRLSAHEYPREIGFVDNLPMTTTGKVIRRILRNQAREEVA
ncbi:AMP-binding protein [Roseibium alexandrii]|uniref:Acyl-coenzyme A synthetase/AMP-(Fatty) acid ligase n=1 Tax=Roseibium alexandrii (strain DSM 17067 / NCIMB 14079 / DFL-11) TaxID=244592 RepID=A0A5E8H4B2_ROSAD|nr:AMP-binding protein [Roseibium alexandrii]EEE47330.2 Acyl-coenzyme A synthetase/AMP-(fatty) acid ligase [Roseibium alexandrii DFL-11]